MWLPRSRVRNTASAGSVIGATKRPRPAVSPICCRLAVASKSADMAVLLDHGFHKQSAEAFEALAAGRREAAQVEGNGPGGEIAAVHAGVGSQAGRADHAMHVTKAGVRISADERVVPSHFGQAVDSPASGSGGRSTQQSTFHRCVPVLAPYTPATSRRSTRCPRADLRRPTSIVGFLPNARRNTPASGGRFLPPPDLPRESPPSASLSLCSESPSRRTWCCPVRRSSPHRHETRASPRSADQGPRRSPALAWTRA